MLANSETAGGRPSRAWSAPPSSSYLLGPCSRSLPRQAMERRRPLLHVSLTLTLRQTVSTPELLRHSVSLLTCRNVPSAFLCRVKGHTLTLCARRRGSLGMRLIPYEECRLCCTGAGWTAVARPTEKACSIQKNKSNTRGYDLPKRVPSYKGTYKRRQTHRLCSCIDGPLKAPPLGQANLISSFASARF